MGLTLLEVGALLGCAAPAAYFASRASAPVAAELARSAGLALLALAATHVGVPAAAAYLLRRGLKGRDMGRRGTPAEAVEMCVRARARARRRGGPRLRRPPSAGAFRRLTAPPPPPPPPPPAARLPWASCAASCTCPL